MDWYDLYVLGSIVVAFVLLGSFLRAVQLAKKNHVSLEPITHHRFWSCFLLYAGCIGTVDLWFFGLDRLKPLDGPVIAALGFGAVGFVNYCLCYILTVRIALPRKNESRKRLIGARQTAGFNAILSFCASFYFLYES